MAEIDLIKTLNLESLLPAKDPLILTHYTSATLPEPLLTACFDLISHTSSAAYAASTRGWHPSAKIREMRESAMHYLIVSKSQAEPPSTIQAGDLMSFLSYQLVEEDGVGPVIYIYEIHAAVRGRGRGVGTALMRCVDAIGKHEGSKKAMLTVFVSNKEAIRFYERNGYAKWDEEYIPPRKRLRSGIKEERIPTYIIMAKDLADIGKTEGGDGEWETDGESET